MSRVKIVEVGPRDGLQNEAKSLSVALRLQLIKKLSAAGLKHIEVGAFVSPKWVPQMQGSEELIGKIFKSKILQPKAKYFSALVPNLRGLQDSLNTPIRDVAVFASCSEGFSQKNINCTIKESFFRFEQVIQEAQKNKVKVRGYLSTAFGCPYDGKIPLSRVVKLTQKFLKMGVYEVAISDTIGTAHPKAVAELIKKLQQADIDLSRLAFHMHNTKGAALANVLTAYQLGIRTFDTSVGGLGGCPYAEGASGNLATEELVSMFDGMKVKSGVSLSGLIKINHWLRSSVGLQTRSQF